MADGSIELPDPGGLGVRMGTEERVIIDPEIQHGKPVVRGTRVPVARILGGLAGGMSVEEIGREYGLTVEDVRAALEYASRLIEQEVHRPLAAR
jgi:uncharacterized protein (DUF433 family)